MEIYLKHEIWYWELSPKFIDTSICRLKSHSNRHFALFFGAMFTLVTKVSNSITYCMEHSPSSEANLFSASQEILCILWIPNVHYCLHKCPPPVPILSQINPVNASYPTSWTSILILSFHLRLILPRFFFHQFSPPKPCMHLSSPQTFYMPRSSHSSQFYHPKNIWAKRKGLPK